MKSMTTLRACCLYSNAAQFNASCLYTFELVGNFTSFDVYITDGALFAFRFHSNYARTLIIEDLTGVVAVFEIILECTK